MDALIGRSQNEESPQRDRGDRKESPSLQGRRSGIQERRFQKEGHGHLRCYFRGETRRRFDCRTWKTSREEGCCHCCSPQKSDTQAGSTTQSKTGKPSAVPSVAKPSPSSPVKDKFGRRNKHQLNHITRSSHIDGTFIFKSRLRNWYLDYVHTCTFPCFCELRRFRQMATTRPVLGLESRQVEMALSGAGVMKDGNRRERTAEKEKRRKGCLRRMVPLARRGRAGIGRKRTTHGRAAGLLQLRRLP